MAEIVGTITNLSDFLSKTQVCLSVKPNDPQQQIICLEADRKYSIPAFQREVRWDDNNLKMLLYDLSRSSKFLGNIILTIKSDHTCEIIDGQQRTTVLMLIVSCIKKKFGTKISTPDLCPLRNEGFTGFQTLLEKAFDQEAITSDDWNAILKSDDYLQLPRIQKLWNTISSSELLADRHKAQGLLDNLCKSEFNIIASYSNDVNTSIQYFLDVNLKGIRLDTEDIFKGYLFSQDSRELTRSLWQKNKRDVLRLNGVTQSSEEKRYPLMKLYEHFFYCDLYLPREGDCEYSTLKFGENFCLTSGFESGSTKYYEGSHLIEAIRDRDYLQNVLSRLNKCVEIMTDIIESEGPSTPFKDKFICAKKVDSIDIQNCHSMLKKILMEKEVIPKILALKYILTYFDGKPHAKEEYKSVYSVFCAAVLFTVFANKKESDTFYNFVRLEEWKSKINKWLYDYNKRICKVIHDQDNAEKIVYTFWNHVVVNMREWNEMDSGELSKKSLREDYITTQGLIILALGRLGEFYCVNPQINMAKSLKGLKKIDWLRNNEACWMNRAIKPNGKINRNEQGIFLTYIQIKRLLSLPISDEEAKKERIMMG